jgi:hypothetical protein
MSSSSRLSVLLRLETSFKRIREARPANSMDKLATRTYALVAKERAKTKSST